MFWQVKAFAFPSCFLLSAWLTSGRLNIILLTSHDETDPRNPKRLEEIQDRA